MSLPLPVKRSGGGAGLCCLLLLLALLAAVPDVLAQVDTFEFDTPQQQQRFRKLSNDLRCPQCQNANLTGSTGGIAEDLRREVHRMIMAGMSDEEIEQFMFDRYGDFIFYRPRLTAGTVFLWFGPLVFLVIGGMVAYSISRRASQLSESGPVLDTSQQSRIREILEQDQGS